MTARDLPCPKCGALVAEPCRSVDGVVFARALHFQRLKLLIEFRRLKAARVEKKAGPGTIP